MQEPHTGADSATELIIKRLTDHVDASIKALKNELKAELAGIFCPKHDELSGRMTAVEDLLETAKEQFDTWATGQFVDWATELRKDTAFTKRLAAEVFRTETSKPPGPATPTDDDPRPMAIDHAVAADPADGPQRVDLTEYGAVCYPRPGTDAATVWASETEVIRLGRRR